MLHQDGIDSGNRVADCAPIQGLDLQLVIADADITHTRPVQRKSRRGSVIAGELNLCQAIFAQQTIQAYIGCDEASIADGVGR